MKIGIIGAGAVGAALTEGWTRAGHDIVLGVRDPSATKPRELAQRFGATVVSVAEASKGTEVVVLAVPWSAVEHVLSAMGDLGGKPLVDATNPLVFEDGALTLMQPDGQSGGERVAALAQNANTVKTLNQVGAEMMSAQKEMTSQPSMFIAGDDEAANAVATKLVSELGFETFHAGDLKQARNLEHFAMVWINQAVFRGLGRDWGFGVIREKVPTI